MYDGYGPLLNAPNQVVGAVTVMVHGGESGRFSRVATQPSGVKTSVMRVVTVWPNLKVCCLVVSSHMSPIPDPESEARRGLMTALGRKVASS